MENNNQPPEFHSPDGGYGQHHGNTNMGMGHASHHGRPQHQRHTAPTTAVPQPTDLPPQYPGGYEQPVAWSPAPGSSRVKGFLRSAAYLPEYVVMLILLAVLVSSLISLMGLGIDAVIPAEESGSNDFSDLYGGAVNNFQLIWSLTALIASLPVFAWLFVRTRTSEAEAPKIKQHRWRKAFLGIFLVVQGLTAVWTFGGFVFDVLTRMIGEGSGVLSYLTGDGSPDPWWQGLITTVLSLAVLVLVIYVMSRDYRVREES